MSNPYDPYPSWPAPAQPAATPLAIGPGAGSPVGRPKSDDRSARTVAAAVLVVVVLVAAVAGFGGVTVVDSPPHPDEWNPAVADLAAFVQEERGLIFEKPVYVDFLPEDEFVADVTGDDTELTDEDRAQIEDSVAQLRALGLVEGEFDLFGEQNELSGDTTLAYYQPSTERITVRGTAEDMNPYLSATIVHELTHALQDQHFDIEQIQADAGEDGDFRARAVIEGDAVNVQDAYVAQLSDEDKAAYDEEERAAYDRSDGVDDEAADAPGDPSADAAGHAPVLEALSSAPYLFGPSFMSLLRADDGNASANDAFENLPASEADLFDPQRFLDGDEPVSVDAPTIPEGAEVIDDGSFGALGWYLVLASRIDAHAALDVVDGWAGDSYVTYRDGGKVCVDIRYKALTEELGTSADDALTEWADAMPDGAASVEQINDRELELSSCDPGTESTSEVNDVTEALAFPVVRLQVAQSVLDAAGDAISFDDAWCYADGAIDAFTYEDLQSSESTPAIDEALQRSALACGLN